MNLATDRFREIGRKRAELVVRCACDILGLAEVPWTAELRLDLSVLEFQRELERRYGSTHSELVYRTDSTLERARLKRDPNSRLAKVILRQGAPRRPRSLSGEQVLSLLGCAAPTLPL